MQKGATQPLYRDNDELRNRDFIRRLRRFSQIKTGCYSEKKTEKI